MGRTTQKERDRKYLKETLLNIWKKTPEEEIPSTENEGYVWWTKYCSQDVQSLHIKNGGDIWQECKMIINDFIKHKGTLYPPFNEN